MPNTLEQAKYELLLQARSILTELKSLGVDELYLQPKTETLPICEEDEPPRAGECRSETLEELCRGNFCQGCTCATTAGQKVFGQGHSHARVMFVGARPTADDVAAGISFSGVAGQLLDRILFAMGFSREDVYLSYFVKCVGQGDHTTQDEIAACQSVFQRQLAAIQPHVVIALGTETAQVLLNKEQDISHMRGVWANYHNTPIMATFHPDDLIRNPVNKREVWDDLKQVLHRLRQGELS